MPTMDLGQVSERATVSRARAGTTVRRVLLACGILSALLYVAMLIVVPMQGDGYSSASQTVSELSAIGAPTRGPCCGWWCWRSPCCAPAGNRRGGDSACRGEEPHAPRCNHGRGGEGTRAREGRDGPGTGTRATGRLGDDRDNLSTQGEDDETRRRRGPGHSDLPVPRAVGFWSAVLATVFSLTYVVGQLAEWLGWLGSQGGPESGSTPFGLAVLLTPSLFLGSSFLAVDILGYSFMSIATLFAARVFTGNGLQRVARWFLTANGLLLPFLALQMYYHPLIWIASLWAVTFPGSTWTLAFVFRRSVVTPAGSRPTGTGLAQSYSDPPNRIRT